MKFAASGSLLDAARTLRNDPRRIIALIAKVTRAVQFAHLQGILHRDLKPGNILLDGRGEPLVSDFGLAKWLDTSSDLTRTLTIFGTPGYIAPEQAHGAAKNLTPAADIYSIGAVLFDLFTGRTPFLGEHALAVIKQAGEKPAPKLRTLAPLADRDVETICAKCLEREPQARYRSAGDLAQDLERWLEGRPIIARPVSPPVRIWRWSKRNRKLAYSLGAVLVLGVLGAVAALTSSRLSSIVQDTELARHSVAVTPFEDLDALSPVSNSAKAATNSFSTALSQTKGIRALDIKPQKDDPWSAEDWKEIGKAAGARFVLNGSVRLREGKQRVALRLIETASGTVAKTLLLDSSSPEEAVKSSQPQIQGALGIRATSETLPANSVLVVDGNINDIGGTSDASARGYYERGREFLFRYNLSDQMRAIDSFRTAVKIDPNYAQAHAMLATACQLRFATDPKESWLDEAQAAAATALRIAPMLPETQRAVGGDFENRGRFRASMEPYLTAYELDPSSSRAASVLGYISDVLGRPDLALLWYERASRRESRPVYADNIAAAWLGLGDYEQAEKAYQTSVEFRPDLPVGALGLSITALMRGDYESARKRCQEARSKYRDNPQPLIVAALIEFFSRHFEQAEQLYREASASDPTGGIDQAGSVRFLSAIGFIRKHSGHDAEGNQLLQQARSLDERELSLAPDNPALAYSLAATYAALEDIDNSLGGLNKAVAAGWIDHHSLQLDPRFDSIRDTQAFKDILARLTNTVNEMRRQVASPNSGFNYN